MAWFCGRSLRCCLGWHWWITFLIEDNQRWEVCGRKDCDAHRTTR